MYNQPECLFCGKLLCCGLDETTRHIAQCMFETCQDHGYQCYCTCPDCKGVRFHPVPSHTKRRHSVDSHGYTTYRQGKRRFISFSNPLLHQVFSRVVEYCDDESLISLSTVNKSMLPLVSPLISDTFTFVLSYQAGEFKYLTPKHVVIRSKTLQRFKTSLPPGLSSVKVEILPEYALAVPVEELTYSVPDVITALTFPKDFNSPVSRWPQSLASLSFLGTCNQDLVNLPDSLKHLRIVEKAQAPTKKLFLPPALIKLDVHGPYDFIGNFNCLEELRLDLKLSKHNGNDFQLDQLPLTIQSLAINDELNQILPSLPDLMYLYIVKCPHPLPHLPTHLPLLLSLSLFMYDHPIDAIPDSMHHLLLCLYNHPLPPLPDSIRSLTLLHTVDHHPILTLPPMLTYLQIGYHYSHTLPSLPITLQSLKLYGLQRTVPPLPPNLSLLELHNYSGDIPILPPSLRELSIDSNFSAYEIPPGVLNLALRVGDKETMQLGPYNLSLTY